MNSLFDHIELVSEDAKPTQKQIEYCMAHDLGVDGGDWYWTLRPNQGCPENWLPFIDSGSKVYMIDNLSFIKDSLFCEYAYIVNLDTDQLEFYCGFQHKPDETNRYGCEEDRGYYPCRMVACFPLDVIAHEINEMEVALEERLTDSIYPMCLADGEYRLSVIRPR